MPLPPLDPGDDTVWERDASSHYYRADTPVPVFEPTPQARRRKKRPKVHPLVLDVEAAFQDSKRKRYDDDGYLKSRRGDLPDLFVSEGATTTSPTGG